MSEVTKKWYVIRAVGGKEKKVKELLELEIDRHKLNSYVEQVLIPTEKNLSNQKGKENFKRKKLFPWVCSHSSGSCRRSRTCY